jgi:hypothetical protein
MYYYFFFLKFLDTFEYAKIGVYVFWGDGRQKMTKLHLSAQFNNLDLDISSQDIQKLHVFIW